MKIGKLERYLMIGLEDAAKIGVSVIKNSTIAGYEIGKYAIRNMPRTAQRAYRPASELTKVLWEEAKDIARCSFSQAKDKFRNIRNDCRNIFNDKSNLY